MTTLTPRRLVALTGILILASTAIFAPAQAGNPSPGDGEPVAEAQNEVRWKDVQTRNHLFLARQNETDRVYVEDVAGPGELTVQDPAELAPQGQSVTDIAQLDAYLVDATETSAISGQKVARFQTEPLDRKVTIRGAAPNVLQAVVKVIATPQLNWTMRLVDCPGGNCNQGTTVAKKTFVGAQELEPGDYQANITFSKGLEYTEAARNIDGKQSYVFDKGDVIRFEMKASEGPNLELGLVTDQDELPIGSRLVWLLRREGHQGSDAPLSGASRVILDTEDAVQKTGWVSDHQGEVADIFVNHTDDKKDDIGARYAVRSAFGTDDIEDLDPTFSLQRFDPEQDRNVTVLMGDQNNASVGMDRDPALTAESQGQLGWRLPEEFWNYDEATPGEYRASITGSTFRPAGQVIGGTTVKWDFRLTDQAVDLRMFPRDSNSHLVKPGLSTTYLVRIQNGGSTRDTVDLDLSFQAAAQQGWRASLEGPGLKTGNRIELDSGESALLRVTVQSPSDTPLGSSQTFTLNATSKVDDQATDEISLIATASEESRDGVDIIGGDEPVDVKLGPRDNATVDLLVWNNATDPHDIRVGFTGDVNSQWNVTLENQGQEGRSLTLRGVPPGDVATLSVDFRTKGDIQTQGTPSESVSVNASIGSAARVKRSIQAQVEFVDNVEVRVLESIEGVRRYMEMSCSSSSLCPGEDGVPQILGGTVLDEDVDTRSSDGLTHTLFRTWITNNGDTKRTFEIATTGLSETLVNPPELYRCTNAFRQIQSRGADQPDTGNPQGLAASNHECRFDNSGNQRPMTIQNQADIRILEDDNTTRGLEGDTVTLEPGQTSEVYVQVKHRTDAAFYAPSDLEFSVQACSPSCGANTIEVFGQDTVQVRGQNDVHDKSAVAVEAVARKPGYFDDPNRLVNLTNEDENPVQGFIALGEEKAKFYKFRVTNGATFPGRAGHPAPVEVSILGGQQNGWEASIKPLDAPADAVKAEPFIDQHTFTNCPTNLNYCRSYEDKEYLLRVEAPTQEDDDRKAVAGDDTTVTIRAQSDALGDSATLNFETEIVSLPRLNISPASPTQNVTAGDQTAFLVDFLNNGSARGRFSFHARPTDLGYSVTPTFDNFTLSAHDSRSVALTVAAPKQASPSDPGVDIVLRARWDDPRKDIDREDLTCDSDGTPADSLPDDAPIECELVTVNIVEEGDVKITPGETGKTLRPGEQGSFQFEVKSARNQGEGDLGVKVELVAPPKWTAQLSRTDFTGDDALEPGESKSVNLVVKAPSTVNEGSNHAFVVRAFEAGDRSNVALRSFSVDIIQGNAKPVIDVQDTKELVERGSFNRFKVEVRNSGTAEGTFPLEVNGPAPEGWGAVVEDRTGFPVRNVSLQPGEQRTLYVNVTAPFEDVDRGTVVEPTFVVYTSNFKSQSTVTLTAPIQDYGVSLDLQTDEIEYVPGTKKEMDLRVTNNGNGNDTINVSMSLQGLGDLWTVTFDEPRVRLEPDESETVEATIRSPREPLPAPRTITFTAWAGTVRGAEVDQWQNRSQPFVVDILDYRTQDIDDDGFIELAVDSTPNRPNDGYPQYREIFPEGRNATARAVFDGDEDGKTDFLIDDPGQTGLDGVSDVYWDPDDIVVDRIEHTPDATFDDVPDYLVDADGDDTVDTFWNGGNGTRGDVDAVDVEGTSETKEYVIDSDGDGRFDKYHNPRTGVVSQVTAAPGQGADTVGLDTNGDDSVDVFYNTESQDVQTATFENVGSFAVDYWYLVILAGVAVAVGVVAVRRRGD